MNKIKENKLFIYLSIIFSVPAILMLLLIIIKPEVMTNNFPTVMLVLFIIVTTMILGFRLVNKRIVNSLIKDSFKENFKEIDEIKFKTIYKKTYGLKYKLRKKRNIPIKYFIPKEKFSSKPKYFISYNRLTNSYTIIDTNSNFYLIRLRWMLNIEGGE